MSTGRTTQGAGLSLFFDETDEDLDGDGILDPGEDLNGNGVLDPGEDLNENGLLDPPEDTDADGVLDKPNYLPGMNPARDDLPGRADALMYFYERESHTLIAQPLEPLRERTTYAVVVTRRLLDADGEPVGSPIPGLITQARVRPSRTWTATSRMVNPWMTWPLPSASQLKPSSQTLWPYATVSMV